MNIKMNDEMTGYGGIPGSAHILSEQMASEKRASMALAEQEQRRVHKEWLIQQAITDAFAAGYHAGLKAAKALSV